MAEIEEADELMNPEDPEPDWFGFLKKMRARPVAGQYFENDRPKVRTDNGWLYDTTQYFAHLGYSVDGARMFLERLGQRAKLARTIDGVNGLAWMDQLSKQERTLARILHFEGTTNYGVERYVDYCKKHLKV